MQKNSRPPIPRQKRKKRNGRFILRAIIFLLLLSVLGGACYSSYRYKVPAQLWESLIPIPEGEKVSVVIEQGMTASQAARAFEVHGALERGTPSELARWMVKFGLDRKIRAGHYSVVPSDPWNIARQLRTLKPALLKAQVLPGLDIFALIDSLESQEDTASPPSFRDKEFFPVESFLRTMDLFLPIVIIPESLKFPAGRNLNLCPSAAVLPGGTIEFPRNGIVFTRTG